MKAIYFWTSIFLLALSSSLWAQDSDDSEREQALTKMSSMEEQAEKAEKNQEWSVAVKFYEDIRELLKLRNDLYRDHTKYERKKRKTLNHLGISFLFLAKSSNAGEKEGYLKKAKKNLLTVLRLFDDKSDKSDQSETYYYLAVIHAIGYQQKKAKAAPDTLLKALYDEILRYMKLSSRNGYNVFVGINSDPELAFLKKDANFIMEILKAVKPFDLEEASNLENPFRVKLTLVTPENNDTKIEDTGDILVPPDEGGVSKEDQKKLLEDIKAHVKKLKQHLDQTATNTSPSKEVIQIYQRLQKLLKRKEDIFHPKYQKELVGILQEFSGMQDKLERVQLGFYFHQGRTILREMKTNFVNERYRLVLGQWKSLNVLAREMSKTGNEKFRKTAESLLNNGKNLRKQAITYIRLKELNRKISGIIIEEYPKKIRIAIINNRPYREGEFIVDERGRKLKLQLKKIKKGRVLFLFQGVEVREFLKNK